MVSDFELGAWLFDRIVNRRIADRKVIDEVPFCDLRSCRFAILDQMESVEF